MKYLQMLKYIRPFALTFMNLFLCVITGALVGMLYPFLFSMLVDEVFERKNMQFFVVIIVCYLLIFLLEQVTSVLAKLTGTYLVNRFSLSMRQMLFLKIFRMRASDLVSIQTGDLLSVLNRDVDHFLEFVKNTLFDCMAKVLQLFWVLLIVAYIDPAMAILMIVMVPGLVAASRFFSRKIKDLNMNNREEYGKFISWGYEIIDGLREIKLLAAQKNVISQFTQKLNQILLLNVRTNCVNFGSTTASQIIMEIMNVVIYIVAVVLIMKDRLTVGGFVALFDYFYIVQAIYSTLNDKFMNVQNNMVSMERVFRILNSSEEKLGNENVRFLEGDIEFKQVFFSYDSYVPVLKEINLHIRVNETIALVGKSGAGKSTIVNMLLGFYQPHQGRICIDGVDLNDVSISALRDNIGMVSQEIFVVDGSIRENLCLGKPTATDEELWCALRQAQIEKTVKSLSDGLDTKLGFDGNTLSGGELQRISIARIFLKNPRILIFDEATSAIDIETEEAIRDAWKILARERTTIIIAHRLQTILYADRIAMLSEGKIVGCDKPDVLLRTCKEYAELFREYGKEGEI